MEHNWRTCEVDDCQECQELVDAGILMCCDECDHPGHVDADGWTMLDDGRTLCSSCSRDQENVQTSQVARQPLLKKEKDMDTKASNDTSDPAKQVSQDTDKEE